MATVTATATQTTDTAYRKVVNAWCMYDWANSAFVTTVKVSFWPIGKNYETWNGENNYYVFVRYLKDEARFEVFLESAERVTEQVTARVTQEKERNLAEWAPCWYLKGENERLRRQWLEFGVSQC